MLRDDDGVEIDQGLRRACFILKSAILRGFVQFVAKTALTPASPSFGESWW